MRCAALPALDEKAAGTRARIGKGPLCRGTAPELRSADRGSQTQRHSAPAGNVATESEEEGEGEGQPCTAARVLAGRDALDPWWRCSRLSKKARTQDFHVKSLNPFDGRLRRATLCCAVTTGGPGALCCNMVTVSFFPPRSPPRAHQLSSHGAHGGTVPRSAGEEQEQLASPGRNESLALGLTQGRLGRAGARAGTWRAPGRACRSK